jgi:hypothetical protein
VRETVAIFERLSNAGVFETFVVLHYFLVKCHNHVQMGTGILMRSESNSQKEERAAVNT